MAVIKCPECGDEMSDKVLNCTNCGYPPNNITNDISEIKVANRGKVAGKIILGAICGFLIGLTLSNTFGVFGVISSTILFAFVATYELSTAIIGGIVGILVLIVIFFMKMLLGM